MKLQDLVCIVPVILGLAIGAGCSKSENTNAAADSKKTTSQVAAKVNSTEITISQINNVLARNPNVKPEAAGRAKREILEKLIDVELAREAAIEKKLDRTPIVLQALEAAKTEILARAYIDQVAAAQPKPTPAEVKKYYAEHPELFSQRRVYRIEEFAVPATEGSAAKLKERVAKARSMQDVAAWLKSQSVPFTANSAVRAAEQLPLDFLRQMQSMKDGDIRVFEAAAGLQVIRVAASKLDPVDEVSAAPRIQQFLINRWSTEVIAKNMKQLKEKAKIQYMGEFTASAAEAGATARAAAEAKAAAGTKAKAEAETQANQDELAKARRAAETKNKEKAAARAKEEETSRARRAAEAKARDAGSKGAQLKPA